MGGAITPALLGAVAGTALQLQQGALWPWWGYAAFLATLLPLSLYSSLSPGAGVRALRVSLAFAILFFSLTALRALSFQATALDASLEGKDIAITGVVAAMPQRNDGGTRFRLDVESSDARLPPHLLLGWYGPAAAEDAGTIDLSRSVPDLKPGERWRMTVR